jgi:hypothetical protein
MPIVQPATKWCHVTLATHRNQRLFKIAAAARFCERQILAVCANRGWIADALLVRPEGIQLLVEVPMDLGRNVLAEQLKADLGDALRKGRVLPGWGRKAFGEGHWCSVVTNAAGLQALRRHLSRQT